MPAWSRILVAGPRSSGAWLSPACPMAVVTLQPPLQAHGRAGQDPWQPWNPWLRRSSLYAHG